MIRTDAVTIEQARAIFEDVIFTESYLSSDTYGGSMYYTAIDTVTGYRTENTCLMVVCSRLWNHDRLQAKLRGITFNVT